MLRRLFFGVPLFALLVALIVLSWTTAAEPAAKPVDPGSVDDVADVIVTLQQRPMLIRLHVSVDGVPYIKHWENQLKRLFDYLDRDGDGFLDKEEARLIPNLDQMLQLFAGTIPNVAMMNNQNMPQPIQSNSGPPPFDDMDTNADGKISFDEFIHYYRHTDAGPMQMQAQNGQGLNANYITDVIFKALDLNKDGRLSKEELLVAEKVLRQFDQNDDELVSMQELQGEAQNEGAPGMMPANAVMPGAIRPGKLYPNVPAMLLPREDASRQMVYRMPAVKEILAEYDKEKTQKLTIGQIGFSKELFEKLDTGKAGTLSAKEMARWVVFHPDIEMAVRLGRNPGSARIEIPAAEDEKAVAPLAAQKTGENAMSVSVDTIQMTLLRAETQYPQTAAVKAQVMQQYKILDPDRKGYVRLSTVEKLAQAQNPNAAQIRVLFPIADRDGNDKLTEKELSDWLDLAASMHGTQTRLTFADNGQSLFEILDANRDGQLSVRELRSAWIRLAPFDKTKQGSISRGEIPRQYQIMVSQAQPFVNANAVAGANFGVSVVQSIPTRGPLWFRKMDVNGDGDVSEREFLGSREDFKRINTTGDGLISVEEAEKADAWFREKMKK